MYIDKPGGVTVEDCGRHYLTRLVQPWMLWADPFPHAYTLWKPSSQVWIRAFKRTQDCRRALGKQVSVKLVGIDDGQWRVAGVLTEVNERGE